MFTCHRTCDYAGIIVCIARSRCYPFGGNGLAMLACNAHDAAHVGMPFSVRVDAVTW